MSDIFISYAREDVGRVEPLAEALESEGWSVWWDPLIIPGRKFDLVIGEELESARCVIVVWSKKSVVSSWVLDEAWEGAERRVLLPLLIEDVRIPLGFRRIQAVNLINWQGELPDSNFDRLIRGLTILLGRPPAPSTLATHIIKSPLVGIFYRSPWPPSEPFINIGDYVEPETVVCIIEAMKLMNEILAETNGKIIKIYVENGEPVEYGQPLFETDKSPPPLKPKTSAKVIEAPISGTFYLEASPASEPLVKVGDQVEPDTIVCFIEAMDMMNEIEAETSGKIVRILAGNGEHVDRDQPLFEIGDLAVLPTKAEAEPTEPELHIIKSPLVGIVYRAASPISEPFVKVGDHVEPDTVVCSIEAMKLVNEILAETSGEVAKIYFEACDPVEYGQPLFGIIES